MKVEDVLRCWVCRRILPPNFAVVQVNGANIPEGSQPTDTVHQTVLGRATLCPECFGNSRVRPILIAQDAQFSDEPGGWIWMAERCCHACGFRTHDLMTTIAAGQTDLIGRAVIERFGFDPKFNHLVCYSCLGLGIELVLKKLNLSEKSSSCPPQA